MESSLLISLKPKGGFKIYVVNSKPSLIQILNNAM